tara:strand:+ start:1609 stop:1770 length:162 start_codon:yes stop_codon:yes gene_type:complete
MENWQSDLVEKADREGWSNEKLGARMFLITEDKKLAKRIRNAKLTPIKKKFRR